MLKYQFIQRKDGWIVRRETFDFQHWLTIVRRGDDYFEHDWQLSDNNAHRFQTCEEAFDAVFQMRVVDIQGHENDFYLEVEL